MLKQFSRKIRLKVVVGLKRKRQKAKSGSGDKLQENPF